ncbi:hypothetical protein CYMTET_9903 [Cymbomonas tetramitiformis]|uniref:Uncharacterized protein n=1 Tax=Cymbomonas tetramitiformis TaxID=36881 RepID=A0AAE0GQK8_9CHLO|nr:hypothetical protein CYMTET_9903 [Cymbomonas tetramitiformis]
MRDKWPEANAFPLEDQRWEDSLVKGEGLVVINKRAKRGPGGQRIRGGAREWLHCSSMAECAVGALAPASKLSKQEKAGEMEKAVEPAAEETLRKLEQIHPAGTVVCRDPGEGKREELRAKLLELTGHLEVVGLAAEVREWPAGASGLVGSQRDALEVNTTPCALIRVMCQARLHLSARFAAAELCSDGPRHGSNRRAPKGGVRPNQEGRSGAACGHDP